MTKHAVGGVVSRVYRRGAVLPNDTTSNVIEKDLDLEAQTRVPSLASQDTQAGANADNEGKV